LSALGPGKKEKSQGGREKRNFFLFPSRPQKEKSAAASAVKAGRRPPVGLGLDRISERRRYNYNWALKKKIPTNLELCN